MPEIVDYLPEKPYNSEGREKCDFWFKTNSEEYWLEIKTRPTNYRKPGHAKAIINGVDEVVEDVKRLKARKGSNVKRLVMFAFYPMYEDSYEIFSAVHLSRIANAVGKNIEGPQISVEVNNARFDIYLIYV
jgi:hypothetical protein